MNKPKLNEQIILDAFNSLRYAVKWFGVKGSVLFANTRNNVLYQHDTLHRLINSLGGYHSIEPVINVLDRETFKRKYLEVWNDIESFTPVPHAIGYFEKLNGTCIKLTNVKTGKHVFSDGSSVWDKD